MNSSQRRKQKRIKAHGPNFTFIDSNQGNVHDFMNVWISSVEKPFVDPAILDKCVDSNSPYPIAILDSSCKPLESEPLIVELTISFDHDQHARNQSTQSLAEADTPLHVQSGSVGTPHSITGSVPDQ